VVTLKDRCRGKEKGDFSAVLKKKAHAKKEGRRLFTRLISGKAVGREGIREEELEIL